MGLERFSIILKAIPVTITAPPITKAKLGSQSPVMSKKPTIFDGLIIFDTAKPMPNKIPDVRLSKYNINLTLYNNT